MYRIVSVISYDLPPGFAMINYDLPSIPHNRVFSSSSGRCSVRHSRASNKGKVAPDLLLHHELPVHVLDGSLGLLVGAKLDQSIPFDVARPVVQRHPEVLDGPKVGKLVVQVLLGALLVQARHENDPSFHSYSPILKRADQRAALHF